MKIRTNFIVFLIQLGVYLYLGSFFFYHYIWRFWLLYYLLISRNKLNFVFSFVYLFGTANCVITFWAHGSKLVHCKCPICSITINKLTPEASLILCTDDEVVEALKKVQGYNLLFEPGIRGLILVSSYFTHRLTEMLFFLIINIQLMAF